MNTDDLSAVLDRLRAEPHETEWLEFKTNDYPPQDIGEYISALANSACLLGKTSRSAYRETKKGQDSQHAGGTVKTGKTDQECWIPETVQVGFVQQLFC